MSALLIVALTHSGCSAVRVNEHRYGESGSAVSVRVQWNDEGTSRHVAGVTVALLRVGPDAPGPWAKDTTRADRGLIFDQLPEGRYRVVLSAPGMETVERTFDVKEGRRMSMRVLVEARAVEVQPGGSSPSGGGGDTSAVAEGVVFVLKAIGTVILVVALIGLVILLADVDDDDCDDCDPCDEHRAQPRGCRCTCHM